MTKNAILEAAMKLSPRQRGELAGRLLSSLDDASADPEAPALWEKEIKRRVAAVRGGKAKFVDGDKALARLKRKYAA